MASANKQQHQDEPDDSEEEDEDYVPTAQGNESDDDDGGDGCSGEIDTAPQLSYRKQRAVDDAFASLFGVKASAAEEISTDDDKAKKDGSKKRKVVSSSSPSSKKIKKGKVGGGCEGGRKSSKKMRRQQRVLAEMFGPSAAADLLSTAGRVVEADELRRRIRRAPGDGDIAGLPSVSKETVIEVKRFAGRDVTVQKVVNSGGIVASSATRPAFARKGAPASMPTRKPSAASAGGGLDAVLTEMKGPQKMSTVEKTGADWETFKEQIGGAELKDELEQKAKGKEAYLEKKDFLTRVDLRQFDREKAERDIQRSQRSGGGGRKG